MRPAAIPDIAGLHTASTLAERSGHRFLPLASSLLPLMPAGGLRRGTVVNFSSTVSYQGMVRKSHYITAKASLRAFTKAVATRIDFERVAFAREEIDKYLRAEGGQLTRPTAFGLLTDSGMKLQEQYSTDGNSVAAAVDANVTGLREIRRSSQYGGFERFDISVKGIQELVQRETSTPDRKIVLFVSPGWPLLSSPGIENSLDTKQQKQLFDTLVNLTTQMQRANLTLYTVNPLGAGESEVRASYYESFLKGVSDSRKMEPGNLALQVLSVQSGGRAIDFDNDVSAALRQCVAETQDYYEITFEPAPPDPKNYYHRVEVKVSKPDLSARARTGYYADAGNGKH